MRDVFERQLKKTIIGQMYFLRPCNFQKLKNATNVSRYLETFRLDRDRFGKFECQIHKDSWKDERVWSYDAKLMVCNVILKAASQRDDDNPILTEELVIKKESLRIKDLPKITHKLHLRLTPVGIDLIPKDLYNKLMEVTDKDILNFSTK